MQRIFDALVAEGMSVAAAAAETDRRSLAEIEAGAKADAARDGADADLSRIGVEVLVEGDAEATLNVHHAHEDPELVELLGEGPAPATPPNGNPA